MLKNFICVSNFLLANRSREFIYLLLLNTYVNTEARTDTFCSIFYNHNVIVSCCKWVTFINNLKTAYLLFLVVTYCVQYLLRPCQTRILSAEFWQCTTRSYNDSVFEGLQPCTRFLPVLRCIRKQKKHATLVSI